MERHPSFQFNITAAKSASEKLLCVVESQSAAARNSQGPGICVLAETTPRFCLSEVVETQRLC